MKNNSEGMVYYFVDESGDPTFYNKYGKSIVGEEGCSQILLMGFIKTTNPEILRKKILNLREEISKDKYLSKIPSLKKTLVSFHAKDDCPEVREKFFKLINEFDFKSEFVVARKIDQVFKKRHQSNENIFYNDLFSKLFLNKLHNNKQNVIYYSTRGNKNRQEFISQAIQTAILSFESKWKTKITSEIRIIPQSPLGEQCLQIIDYMNWAVQRAFIKKEDRYLKFVEEKISFLVDIYDFNKYPNNFYNKRNKFDLEKISPLQLVSNLIKSTA